MKCHIAEVLKSFVLGLSKAIRQEAAINGQISDEEWEIVRPTKRERRDEILGFMLDDLRKNAKCSNCTTWNVKISEIWGSSYQLASFSDDSLVQKNNFNDPNQNLKLINAGTWKPFDGLQMTDVLFPHISHGFRNKTFHLITYHVSKESFRNFRKNYLMMI